jgi:hypothetical protein
VSRITRHWLILPALTFSAIVYYPVTHGYFYLDDFLNLYHIVNDEPWRYLVRENGGHVLLSRNTLFYLTFQLAGPRPELFYWSAFATHLLNVGLLFLVIARLTGRPGLAAFGAAFWGISPLNEGALGWYSVYGHAVVGTALLVVLAQASRCVANRQAPSKWQRRLWYVLALVAATSFGTGVAIAMLLPFALFLILTPLVRRPPLLSLVVVVPAVYFALTRLYEYTARADAPARSIVGSLLSSVPAVVELFARIAGFGVSRWLTGFILPTPTPRLGWYLTLAAVSVAVLIAAWYVSPPVRRQIAACALLTAGAYGIIALGRGPLMQIAADALIQALTRYQYVAPIPLTIILCLVLAQLGGRIDPRLGFVALVTWYIIAGVGYARSGFVIDVHDTERQQTRQVLASIRAAIDAQPPGTTVRIKNAPFPPIPLQTFVPGWAGAFTIFYPDNVVDGRRLEFVEPGKHVFAAHRHGRRIRHILVMPP